MIHFFAEWKKIHRRKLWLLYVVAILIILLWNTATLLRNPFSEQEALTGYNYLILSLSLVNQMFLPVILAACASRICDIEAKGDTWKLLFTMQSRSSLFKNKIFINVTYILAMNLIQYTFVLVIGQITHVTQPVPWSSLNFMFLGFFCIDTALYILQQSLSLLMKNPLMPLFIGLFGTFIGIFTAFFPDLPLRFLFPWGYYITLCPVNLHYDKASETALYYLIDLPWPWLAILMVFGIAVYLTGKHLFLKKEV